MNEERLQRQENILRADAANPKGVKFDLGTWAAPADVSSYVDAMWQTNKEDAIPVACGTKACAFGLSVISGEFKAEGLYANYDPIYDLPPSATGVARQILGYNMHPAILDGNGVQQAGFQAAMVLFDIDYETACYLFDPQCYECTEGARAEIAVADRIRDLRNDVIDKAHHPTFCHEEDDED